MTTGLLSLKWNNHQSTFINMLTDIRCKESLSDVTLTCGGKFYSLHKFVLSTCSEYFEKIFQKTAGKHPVVVLKDISSEDFEALLHYMYIGEVNVVQERLAGLIKAAECLQIKGLAVPDDGQSAVSGKSSSPSKSKRSFQKSEQEISANRKKRKTSISSAEDISANSNHKDNEAQKSNNQAQNTNDHGQTSDDERSSTRSSKKQSSSKDTPNFDSDSELQTNDSYVNNSEVHEVKIEPDETEQFFTEENVEDSKEDVLQGQLLQDNQLCTQENHQGSSLTSPQTEDIREWGSCVENAAFESAFSSFDQPSVLSGTSFLSAISQLRSLSSTVLTSDTPSPQPVTSTPQSQPETSSSNSANSSQQHSSKTTKAFCCNSCSYRTDVYHNLKIHLRTHTGERPYACPLCPYRGTQLFHVQRHMRTHTGEKPYGCHLCPYKSNRKDHLTEHMLASHKVDYRTRGVGIN